MVCQGYKAPDSIDPRLLDPKYALEEVEDDKDTTGNDRITSLKKLLTEKRNRSGYTLDEGKTQLFNHCDLLDFLQAEDPHEYLSTFHRFRLDAPAMELIKDLKPPKDLETICADIKVCGRREFSDMLKLRYKYKLELDR